ncbi:unnamed protein product [Durusdinium trenchii]|uniref:Silicon transporter n=1 Tax=Durusdinium trenchii TaxID=1381693 RepID=A0ABP0KHQ5_9DINO
MGGAYVGMAGLLSLVIGGNMASKFITQKAVFAALFPINLLLVLTTGGQLFTGNSATMAIGVYEKKCTTKDLLRNWAISYVANICGCLLIDAVARYTGMFTGGAQEMAVHTVMKKCSATFGQTVVKGIMCNWLVCMAVWLCTMAKDLTSLGRWWASGSPSPCSSPLASNTPSPTCSSCLRAFSQAPHSAGVTSS